MVKSNGDMFEEGIRAPSRAASKAKALQLQDDEYDVDRNDEPEEVSANSDDIRKLRELHEQMMLPADKRTKKRKARQLPVIAEKEAGDDEEKLDDSVLAALDSVNDGRPEEGGKVERSAATESKNRPNGINIYATRSCKIGDIDVQVLQEEESILSAFGSPKSALEFAAKVRSSRARVSHAVFATQKKGGPSSKFSLKSR